MARSLAELREISWRLSREIIEMTTKAESGHPSSSLSAIDVLTALYFGGVMRYDPGKPAWPERDRFILSKGHAAPGLYAVLAEAGFFDRQLLGTLRQIGSPVEGHPNARRLAGVEASTGSLGQGLSIGLGHALAGRMDGLGYRVYVMIGDGESDEGQVWEAAMSAAKYGVSNLTAILDYNQYQQTGPVSEVMPSLEPIAPKWQAFGWHTIGVDGHNLRQICDALDEAETVKGRPTVILAETVKGKGVPFMEGQFQFHNAPISQAQWVEAMRLLAPEEVTR